MIVLLLYVQINWGFNQGRNVIVSVKDLRSVVYFSTKMLDPFNMTACVPRNVCCSLETMLEYYYECVV